MFPDACDDDGPSRFSHRCPYISFLPFLHVYRSPPCLAQVLQLPFVPLGYFRCLHHYLFHTHYKHPTSCKLPAQKLPAPFFHVSIAGKSRSVIFLTGSLQKVTPRSPRSPVAKSGCCGRFCAGSCVPLSVCGTIGTTLSSSAYPCSPRYTLFWGDTHPIHKLIFADTHSIHNQCTRMHTHS